MKKIIYFLVSVLIACSGSLLGLWMNVPLWKGAIISFVGFGIVVLLNALLESAINILNKRR